MEKYFKKNIPKKKNDNILIKLRKKNNLKILKKIFL